MIKVCLTALATALALSSAARADHTCDPPDPGWRVVPDHEFVDRTDGVPVRDGDTWYVERTTRVLPYCNYFDEIGNYSLRSYSLALESKTERVVICRGNVALAPYAGPCPPK